MKTETNYPKTLVEAIRYFSDLDVAQDFFVSIRWPDGVTCPHCGSKNVSYLKNQRRWKCSTDHARRQFSAKVGTVFEDSPIGLDGWLVAVWLEVNAKNSISSYELHRALGITQKSAWFMLHRVREALAAKSFEKMGANGPTEIDETAVGGVRKNMHLSRKKKFDGGGSVGKTIVMGLLERHTGKPSQVRAQVVPDNKRESLWPVIHKNVALNSTIYTDALLSYQGLGVADYFHYFIDHAETYVKGQVHTNGLENFWTLFKRCIKGTHVSIDPAHLDRYIISECFRFNQRELNDGQRLKLALGGVSGKRLTYKALTGALEGGWKPTQGA